MPSGRIDQSLYIGPYTTIEAMNTATLYKPGELGSQIQIGTKGYQLIQLDSGAVAATPVGVPLCGHVAYWKSRSSYIVTNDIRFAEGFGATTGQGATSVAGVFNSLTSGAAGTASLTAGNYGGVQQRGTHVGIFTASAASTAGQLLVSDTANTAKVNAVALATAPAYPIVGIATGATSAVTTNYTPARLGGWDLVDQG